MLDGFVIKGNELSQAPIVVAEVQASLLKKRYVSISVSVLIHVLAVFILLAVSEKHQPKQVITTKKAIKSYLYKMPIKKMEIKQEVAKQEEIKPKQEDKKVIPKQVAIKQESATKPIIEKEKIQKEVIKKSTVMPASSTKVVSTTTKNENDLQKPVQATFSAYQQLDSLRNSINKQMMAKEVSQQQKFRSASVMHAEQIPVPHSEVQLTPEQERDKRTTKMSDEISITKYDNGVCTIEREQFLGSPVPASSSAFACGESKFDKGFRVHMEKVQAKLKVSDK